MNDDEELAAVAASWNPHTFDMQQRGDAGIVCIHRFMFTWAILAGMATWGYEDRWCYSSYAKARAALDAWDGADGTEPSGWHRHPATGRRVDEDGRQYVAP